MRKIVFVPVLTNNMPSKPSLQAECFPIKPDVISSVHILMNKSYCYLVYSVQKCSGTQNIIYIYN